MIKKSWAVEHYTEYKKNYCKDIQEDKYLSTLDSIDNKRKINNNTLFN